MPLSVMQKCECETGFDLGILPEVCSFIEVHKTSTMQVHMLIREVKIVMAYFMGSGIFFFFLP
jgi:hypothetical protein